MEYADLRKQIFSILLDGDEEFREAIRAHIGRETSRLLSFSKLLNGMKSTAKPTARPVLDMRTKSPKSNMVALIEVIKAFGKQGATTTQIVEAMQARGQKFGESSMGYYGKQLREKKLVNVENISDMKKKKKFKYFYKS